MEHTTVWGVIEFGATICLILVTAGLTYVTFLNFEIESHRHEEQIVHEVLENRDQAEDISNDQTQVGHHDTTPVDDSTPVERALPIEGAKPVDRDDSPR